MIQNLSKLVQLLVHEQRRSSKIINSEKLAIMTRSDERICFRGQQLVQQLVQRLAQRLVKRLVKRLVQSSVILKPLHSHFRTIFLTNCCTNCWTIFGINCWTNNLLDFAILSSDSKHIEISTTFST